ncbi:GNAT family N-acetyltransferase [Terriglobus albidus]|uniref:GNAT family N-acetyltransferase n=1 Tax=Terriglobus albidus TaxID=1592106 RepID=UPI0021DF9831|nr:GNAT family N-acetyltransferase [Terriglobus albidus]
MPPIPLTGHPLIDGWLGLELDRVSLHPVHKVPAYFFRMVDLRTRAEVGRINLRLGSEPHVERYAGHVGYFVEPAYRGHGCASRALRLLMRIARGLGIDPLWITCDPDNIPSRRTCERAGAEFIEIVDVPEDCVIYQSGHRRKCRYRLKLSEPGKGSSH